MTAINNPALWERMQAAGYTVEKIGNFINSRWWCGKGAFGSIGRTREEAINREANNLPDWFKEAQHDPR